MFPMRRHLTCRRQAEHADAPARIRSVVLALQAYREHGAKELEAKLARKGYDALTSAQVIEELKASGLVCDRRFAEAFTRSHAARGHGPLRIRHELKSLGVTEELIEASLSQAELDWSELAARVRRRKFGDPAPKSYAERAKQMRFLQYRGFSSSQMRAAFDSPIDPIDVDTDLDPDVE